VDGGGNHHSIFDGGSLPGLLLDNAEDGKPKSYGYAEYNGVRLKVEDMAE